MKKIWILLLFSFFLYGCSKTTVESRELFSEGLLAVENNSRWGYINNKGKIIIDFLYDDAGAFYGKNAIVQLGTKMHLINKKGQNVLNANYDVLFRDETTGLLIYKDNGKWGLMNSSGKKLTEALYDHMTTFSEGLSRVRSGSNYGFINEKGKTVVSLTYSDARVFSNGLAAVKIDDLWGYINTKGKLVIDAKYLEAYSFDLFGNAKVRNSDTLPFHIINKKEKVIMSGDSIRGSGPLYGVRLGNDYYLHKSDGKKFVETKYTDLWTINQYFINAEINDSDDLNIWFTEKGKEHQRALYNDSDFKQVVYNQKSTEIFMVQDGKFLDVHTSKKSYRFEADDVTQIIDKERFIIERSNKYGIINKNGDILIEFLYDYLIKSDDGFIVFFISDKMGFMNSNFKVVLSAIYDDMNPTYNIYNL